ncbi:protein OSCP1 [Temnothorax curvispinosus]|uniref:Protein OSCP1 n=1 Tax=Temnothorax curvispinosus TaxID=300111 RepID=A0A6J1Q5R6_9HYME|nr:protein OSCP1 [Temnothorax curvispinosus]XP_024877548.1 protein OSCP1 [Temnothorax curvispinosus]XP_024877549.1 protein OSCP1 [Temnothorax curvispinosus]XP_024877550.1 protein OSCP1 [Temnothorax curvispinosus]XP_024877552.1 protein OSCP1 [Temnothorax curvispinosus]
MTLHSTPILYLNMGGEMLYVLRQRLKAQKIDVDKTIQVLDDVTTALLNPKILSPIFEESPMIGVSQLRATLESVALSSIMKLDKSSMDKLFDLMIMMVKYQLKAATGPREVILIILNHIDAMRDMVSDVSAQKCVSMVHQMIVNFYGCLTFDEVWNARQSCLKELEPYNVRVSILLRRGLQNDDASFNVTPQKYDEKYGEHRNTLATMRIKDVSPETCCGGSLDTFGDRKTLLGKNIYLPTYGITESARRDSQQLLRDCGAKAELGMLAVQLGTEETNYERPFTLNLLSNMDEENVNNANREIDTEGNNAKRSNAGNEKPKLNEDYKAKLDTVYADFFEDEHEGLKRSMDLLDLLDEIE